MSLFDINEKIDWPSPTASEEEQKEKIDKTMYGVPPWLTALPELTRAQRLSFYGISGTKLYKDSKC